MPCGTVLLTDVRTDVNAGLTSSCASWPMSGGSGSSYRVGYYHSGGVNVVWTDGHVTHQPGGSLGTGTNTKYWTLAND